MNLEFTVLTAKFTMQGINTQVSMQVQKHYQVM